MKSKYKKWHMSCKIRREEAKRAIEIYNDCFLDVAAAEYALKQARQELNPADSKALEALEDCRKTRDLLLLAHYGIPFST